MHTTVSFHNFKSRNLKLSVSNPNNKYVAYVSVLSRISNCQGLGRKNKHEILKTDRILYCTLLCYTILHCARLWYTVLYHDILYTQDITKLSFHWKVLLKVRWRFPVRIHWESDSPSQILKTDLLCLGRRRRPTPETYWKGC